MKTGILGRSRHRRKWLFFALFIATPSLAQQQQIDLGIVPGKPIRIQMNAVPTGDLVEMLLKDVMRVPYVIAPEVLDDRRQTSIRLDIPPTEIPQRVVDYLRRTGFTVQLVGGTVYVSKGGKAPRLSSDLTNNIPLGSPVDLGRDDMPRARERADYADLSDNRLSLGGAPVFRGDPRRSDVDPDQRIVGYVPAHRDPGYFVSIIASLLPDLKFGSREESKGEADVASVREALGSDVLIFAGSDASIAKARQLVQLLDRPRPMVAVKAVVMQVSDIQERGSALSFLLKIGGGKLALGSYAADPPAAQFVRIATEGLSAVLSAARTDSRFRVVATPNLAVLSGSVGMMNSGAQVPTLGSTAVLEGGTPVQSVVYRESGITLSVRPIVRGDLVEMAVKQERSTFIRTTTGVEDSPTLQKATADASVILKSGESVMLAGLTEDSSGNTREGLFGGLLGIRSRDKSNSELVIVLTAEIVPTPPAEPGLFIEIADASCVRTDNPAQASARTIPCERKNDADPLAPVHAEP